MSLSFGNFNISNLAWGNSNVASVWWGNIKVWGGEAPVNKCLCFERGDTATSTPTIMLWNMDGPSANFEYSVDNMASWQPFIPDETEISISGDIKVYMRGDNPNGIGSQDGYFMFEMSDAVKVSGSIMSLLDNGLGTSTIIPSDYCFTFLFDSCPIETPPELPATTLTTGCYNYMFEFCSKLTRAPELPAKNLEGHCYNQMFSGCRSLISAPKLPATTLKVSCYYQMFKNCAKLTTVPQLPATTLVQNCYNQMFYNCKALYVSSSSTSAASKSWRLPQSGSGTATSSHTSNMFYGCLGTRSSNTPTWSDYLQLYTQNDPIG